MQYPQRVRAVLLTGGAVLAAACDRAPPTASTGNDVASGQALGSSRPVVIADGPRALMAARFQADSIAVIDISLGSVRVAGSPGDTVALTIAADYAVLQEAGRAAAVLVSTADAGRAYALRDLVAGRTVYRFERPDTIDINFRLTKQVARVVPGAFRLVQHTSARLVSAAVPYGLHEQPTRPAATVTAAAEEPVECRLLEQTGTCGGTSWSMDRFSTVGAFPDFQSDDFTGVSSTITITFSVPVEGVTTIVRDSDFEGNRIEAYLGAALVASDANITASGCGTLCYAEDTVTFPTRIDKLVLIPAPADYVTYTVLVRAPPPQLCKIPEDANFPEYTKPFNDLAIRRAMEEYLARSNPTAPVEQRHEEFGYVRKNPDGTYRIDPAAYTPRSQCESRIVVPEDPTILAVFHTHPFRNTEVMKCPGAPTDPYNGRANNGGSDADWAHNLITNNNRRAQGLSQVPYYIIDLEYAYYNYPMGVAFDPANKSVYRSGAVNCKWVY